MADIEDYRTRLHDPGHWVRRSLSLFQSAETVWQAGVDAKGDYPGQPRAAHPLDTVQSFGYYKVAMMLYGYAVETALKGLLIAQHSDKITVTLEADGGGNIQKVSLAATGDARGGHDLVQLAKNAGVVSPDDQQDVDEKAHLRTLSGYITWRGRYPVPKSIKASEKEEVQRNADTIGFVRQFLRKHLQWY